MDDLIAAFSAGFSFISLSLSFFVFGGSFKKKKGIFKARGAFLRGHSVMDCWRGMSQC